jgi:hypothetical protein
VRRADNLTAFTCRLSRNLGGSTSWNPKGLSRPVQGLLYLYHNYKKSTNVRIRLLILCNAIHTPVRSSFFSPYIIFIPSLISFVGVTPGFTHVQNRWKSQVFHVVPYVRQTSAFKRPAMSQPVTAENRVRSRANTCKIFDWQSGKRAGFTPTTSAVPMSVSLHRCSTFIFILLLLLPEGHAGKARKPPNKATLFRISESTG